MEYSVVISAVAIGWSGYFNNLLEVIGINLPTALTASFLTTHGGFIDLPAVLVIGVISYLLIKGIKESAWVNNIIVVIKLAVIILFILLAFPHVNSSIFCSCSCLDRSSKIY